MKLIVWPEKMWQMQKKVEPRSKEENKPLEMTLNRQSSLWLST